jgi:hypothetical protein
MAVVADIEEIGIIRASAWVVSVLLVFRLTTTIATPALWNCPREVNSGSVVWTTRSVVTGPTANATRRFSGCGIRQSRKDREAGPDQDKRMSPPRTAVGSRFEINGAIQVHRRSTLASIMPSFPCSVVVANGAAFRERVQLFSIRSLRSNSALASPSDCFGRSGQRVQVHQSGSVSNGFSIFLSLAHLKIIPRFK